MNGKLTCTFVVKPATTYRSLMEASNAIHLQVKVGAELDVAREHHRILIAAVSFDKFVKSARVMAKDPYHNVLSLDVGAAKGIFS